MSIYPENHNRDLKDLPGHTVYNLMSSIELDMLAQPTTETCRQADLLWPRLEIGGRKGLEKRLFFYQLLHAGKLAWHGNATVRYYRRASMTKQIFLQVIDAAVQANLFANHRSPPGSPKMSRLVPLYDLALATDFDPWSFDPPTPQQLVFLRDRSTRRDIAFDSSGEIPAAVQRKLELINKVNGRYRITFEPYEPWSDWLLDERQLRPVHYAIFTDNWFGHGRIYTGQYGHQGLRKLERQTIRFDDEPSIELDYGGLHCRMLYHLRNREFRGDPYALWGPEWLGRVELEKPLRLMAKNIINAAINAKNSRAAISACNEKMACRTKDGHLKTGKEAHTANMLRQAVDQTGMKFSEIYDLARRVHAPVADDFGSDAGMKLMNLDGAIALEVLYHFASRGLPCLGCHDSFVVPASRENMLRSVMESVYEGRFGFSPIVKP